MERLLFRVDEFHLLKLGHFLCAAVPLQDLTRNLVHLVVLAQLQLKDNVFDANLLEDHLSLVAAGQELVQGSESERCYCA